MQGMKDRLLGLVLLLAANAAGLVVAALVFERMSLDLLSFLFVVVLFTVVLAVARPVIARLAEAKAPVLTGGLAVLATWASLVVTDLLSDGLDIEGVGTWIGATVVVWLFTVVAGVVLPKVFLEQRTTEGR
jgi:putative membrane protein